MFQAMGVEKPSGPLFPAQELAPVEPPRWEGACHAVRATGKGRREGGLDGSHRPLCPEV